MASEIVAPDAEGGTPAIGVAEEKATDEQSPQEGDPVGATTGTNDEANKGDAMDVVAPSSVEGQGVADATPDLKSLARDLLEQALATGSSTKVGKALVAWEKTLASDAGNEGEAMDVEGTEEKPEDEKTSSLRAQALTIIDQWRAELGAKSLLDAQSHKDNHWYAGSIKEVKTAEDGTAVFTVRFTNFSEKHNEVFSIATHASRLMPQRAHTGTIRVLQQLTKPAAGATKKRRGGDDEEALRQKKAAEEEEAKKVVAMNRYGRAIKRSAPAKEGDEASNSAGGKGNKQRARKRKASEVGGEEEGGDAAGITDTQGKDSNDWICGYCDQLDREDDNDRLVLCDGPCKRSFHQSCLGMSTETLESLEGWFCDQCIEKEHQCFVCGDMGKDHVVGGVHKCLKASCGKFYHQHCADQMRAAQISKQQDEAPAGSGEEGGGEEQEEHLPWHFKFVCSHHSCDVCGRGKENGYRSKLFTCLRCPRAYHANCLPPGVKFHEYLCLCPEHAHMGLPPLPGDEETYNNDVSDRDDGWLTLVLKSLDLPRGPPSRATDVAHFRLCRRFFDEVYSKPPPFSHIPGLRYTCKVLPTEPGSECQCKDVCDSACLNRVLHIECVGGCKDDGKVEKFQNCKVGPECTNRAFKNKEYVKHQVFRESGRGWGLKTLEDVKKGQLVFEYVGEVIDDDELDRRLEDHAENHPNDPNMYIMELESGLYLDARHKGNSSRYINHSCDPNCELQKWNVKGFTRIGIMAIHDIPAGTPLSYDYQFATSDESKFKCFCGSGNCRGSLAPKSRSVENEIATLLQQAGGKLSRTDRKKLIELSRKRERREQAKVEQMARASQKKKSLTSRFLPGDPTADIKGGPPPKYARLAQEARLFMVRNTRTGTDFLRRRDLMFRRAAQAQQQQQRQQAETVSST